MRWATPDGVTVDTITLSETAAPTRPGDPAKHYGPRDYLKVRYGGRQAFHCADLDELKQLAEAEAWDVGQLAQVPEYAVIDATDGYTYTRGGDGEPFDKTAAAEFAAKRNAEAKPGQEKRHRIYQLNDVTEQVLDRF